MWTRVMFMGRIVEFLNNFDLKKISSWLHVINFFGRIECRPLISFKILFENLNLALQHCCHQCCGSRRLRIQAKKDLEPIVVELFHFGPAPASRDGGSSSSPVVHNLLLKNSLENSTYQFTGLYSQK